MSKQAKLGLAVLAVAVLIAFLMVTLRPEPEAVTREERAPLVRVATFAAGTEPLTISASGTVQPREEVTISAQVGGRLVAINPQFREGGLVGSGATLLRIEPSDYRNRVRSAQADVAAQEVAVLQASEEARIARDELDRFARRETASDPGLQTVDANDYAARILPPRELAGMEQTARGGGNRDSAPNRLATREPQLRSARAARERASAQLADARLALDRTVVRAPFGGLVRSETVAMGQLVQPGQELGSIVSTAAYEVRVSLTEREASLVPGLLTGGRSRIPASVFLDYGDETFRWSAWVDRADAILDPKTRTIDVFLRVPDPLRGGVSTQADSPSASPPLLLGSFVRAEITGGASGIFAKVPVEALRPGNTVWIVRAGKLRIVPVRVLQRSDEYAVVSASALTGGGQIVTSPLRAPVDAMAVRIAPPDRTPATKRPPVATKTAGTRTGE